MVMMKSAVVHADAFTNYNQIWSKKKPPKYKPISLPYKMQWVCGFDLKMQKFLSFFWYFFLINFSHQNIPLSKMWNHSITMWFCNYFSLLAEILNWSKLNARSIKISSTQGKETWWYFQTWRDNRVYDQCGHIGSSCLADFTKV